MTTEISYGDFSKNLHRFFGDRRTPIDVSIEISRRCPLNCQHCYNNLPMGDLAARQRELTKEEYELILTDLAEMGIIWILFTGGEIFARKDFLDIYTFAKKKGFIITLFTNGILINEKIADYLREYPPFSIEITLYGRTKGTYEALTQLPGSYDRCMRAITLLRERGLPLQLKTVATSVNKHEVIAMKEFAEQELGTEFRFDALMSPRIDCSRAPLNVRLSPEDVVSLDLHWSKVANEYKHALEREALAPPRNDTTTYICGGGMKSFAIDPYGHMSICVMSHQETYDIRQGGVREGWERFLLGVRQRARKRLTKCAQCRIRAACTMCPANGELENGDPESPVEFLCEVAHLRTLALGLQVPEHGFCEFCSDSERKQALLKAADRIRQREIDPREWQHPQTLLPVLNDAPLSSVCGGCAVSR